MTKKEILQENSDLREKLGEMRDWIDDILDGDSSEDDLEDSDIEEDDDSE